MNRRRRRARCAVCTRSIALTRNGSMWDHGRPLCPGSRRMPADPPRRERIWSARHRGRRVTTIRGGIDTWTDTTEGAA